MQERDPVILMPTRGFGVVGLGLAARLNRGSTKSAGETLVAGDNALLMWLQIDKCVFSLVRGV